MRTYGECFEKSKSITGCWGYPYSGFVSTSTKYTTQFACMATFSAAVKADRGKSYSEFFRDAEYGQYLESFADAFNLRPLIHLQSPVLNLQRASTGEGWSLVIADDSGEKRIKRTEHFDHVIIATGVAASPKPLQCSAPILSTKTIDSPGGLEQINGQRIVVIGGGESAVAYAERLAHSDRNNEIFLSLKTGIRVSPRYHPIRGVPSDFLRNRLMLSIHPHLRNLIGHHFVRCRIRYQELFESLFPHSGNSDSEPQELDAMTTKRRKEWADRLTQTAKDDLFNVFHNKSDNFLDAVGDGRIKIIGSPVDSDCTIFHQFNSPETEVVSPDFIVPAIGYRSLLAELTNDAIRLEDFYLGCTHVKYPDLHLVGFARPIIGNIPSISEVQAEYICSLIAKKIRRPDKLAILHDHNQAARQTRYGKLSLDIIYPVEMFPYCDHLAKKMGGKPRSLIRDFRSWCKMQLSPASTLHYRSPCLTHEKIYMPWVLILLLLLLLPLNLMWRLFVTDEVHKEVG